MWNDRHISYQKYELIVVLFSVTVPDCWAESVANAGCYTLIGICRGDNLFIVYKHFEDASPKSCGHEGNATCIVYR